MSLEEKIGQLVFVGINAGFLNQESDAYRALRRQVEENHVGGIILFRGPVYESVHLVNRMQKHARRPLLVSADLEAGAGMRFDDTVNFPWNMAVAATGKPDYARRQGEMTAREARALGIGQIFAPVVDVNNNAANPVINVRSYGEDPADVARFAVAFTDGAQSGGVIATAKHFPGHGDTAVDSHRGLPVINVEKARLQKLELIPFRAVIEAGIGAVMSAHIGLPLVDPTQISALPRDAAIRPAYVDEGGEVMIEKRIFRHAFVVVLAQLSVTRFAASSQPTARMVADDLLQSGRAAVRAPCSPGGHAAQHADADRQCAASDDVKSED